MGNKAIFNWSGGKDSSLTLYHVLKAKQYDIKYLVTSCSEQYDRISMHGVRIELLDMQAAGIGLPLRTLELPEGLTMPDATIEQAVPAEPFPLSPDTYKVLDCLRWKGWSA